MSHNLAERGFFQSSAQKSLTSFRTLFVRRRTVLLKLLIPLLCYFLAVALTIVVVLKLADPSPSTVSACQALYEKYPALLDWDPLDWNELGEESVAGDENYTYAREHYWSQANADPEPTCVFFPSNAEEVSFAVQTLNLYPNVLWAMKSGGHNCNANFSSVNQGVLISFRPNLQDIVLSEDRQTVEIGPGARWGEVIEAVNPCNVTVVGGRLGDVGVGGYTLGGGLSFLTPQYGFTADNTINYEVVLANGTIANVNSRENTDLWWALKGGGNQFAIVTKYTMKTYPISPEVWGGYRLYSNVYADEIINATHAFLENYNDTKAYLFTTFETAIGGLLNIFAVFFFYDGPVPPPGLFDAFDAMDSILDDVKSRPYPDLLAANDELNFYSFRYLIRIQTIPFLPGDTGRSLFRAGYTTFSSYATAAVDPSLDLMIFSWVLQPLPHQIATASAACGGNLLALNPADGHRMWVEYDLSWINPQDDERANTHIRTQSALMVDLAMSVPDQRSVGQTTCVEVATSYGPLFSSESMPDQEPLKTLPGDTYQRLKEVQLARDPAGLFRDRTGGFKLT